MLRFGIVCTIWCWRATQSSGPATDMSKSGGEKSNDWLAYKYLLTQSSQSHSIQFTHQDRRKVWKSGGMHSWNWPVKIKIWGRGRGAPWARATKNVKKPPGEKGRTFRKEEMLHGVQWIPEWNVWVMLKSLNLDFCITNKKFLGFSHTFDSGVCYCTK